VVKNHSARFLKPVIDKRRGIVTLGAEILVAHDYGAGYFPTVI
jgi:hypothetical protein